MYRQYRDFKLGREREEQLAREGRLEPLVLANIGVVYRILRRYNLRNLRGVDFEDLLQEGIIGLMEAARRWDPDAGTKFSNFASWWVHARISKAIRKHGWTITLPDRIYYKYFRLLGGGPVCPTCEREGRSGNRRGHHQATAEGGGRGKGGKGKSEFSDPAFPEVVLSSIRRERTEEGGWRYVCPKGHEIPKGEVEKLRAAHEAFSLDREFSKVSASLASEHREQASHEFETDVHHTWAVDAHFGGTGHVEEFGPHRKEADADEIVESSVTWDWVGREGGSGYGGGGGGGSGSEAGGRSVDAYERSVMALRWMINTLPRLHREVLIRYYYGSEGEMAFEGFGVGVCEGNTEVEGENGNENGGQRGSPSSRAAAAADVRRIALDLGLSPRTVRRIHDEAIRMLRERIDLLPPQWVQAIRAMRAA